TATMVAMNPAKDPADDPAADPFLTTPRSAKATGLDNAPPPPPTQRVDLPPPPQASQALPAQPFAGYGATYPPAPERWRRTWGVTMLRTVIGLGVALVISVPLVIVLSLTVTDPYLAGYAFGAVIAPILSYFTF